MKNSVFFAIALFAVAALSLIFYHSGEDKRSTQGSTSEVAMGAALSVLNEIEATADSKVEYDRKGQFQETQSQSWADLDGDGCDTAQEAYKRDLTGIVWNEDEPCEVKSGTLTEDPYTGEKIDYVRGAKPATVDIDHVVALEDACFQGLCDSSVPQEKRVEFANDPYNLLVVDSGANRQKGAKSIDEWIKAGEKSDKGLLIRDEYMCEYVARVVGIKHKYDIGMTQGEHARIKDILTSDCANQPIPADTNGEWK